MPWQYVRVGEHARIEKIVRRFLLLGVLAVVVWIFVRAIEISSSADLLGNF